MSNKDTIDTLERKLAELERKGNALVDVINDLRREDGLPPRGPFGGGGGGSRAGGGETVTSIRPDTFYGKKMQTAVREYLEMRKAVAGRSDPATPRAIYDAITQGGYEFETKDETTALVSLRSLLRKRTQFFHKLPNGTYGLTSWYPDAKKPKNISPSDDAGDDGETLDADKEQETATTPKVAAAS